MGSTRNQEARPRDTNAQRSEGDVTGTDPQGPLPQNGIARVRTFPQGPIREGRASTTVPHCKAALNKAIKGDQSSDGIREQPNNQCSTG